MRWLVPAATVVLVFGLMLAPLYNDDGRTCDALTFMALDPGYRDGENGGYPNDSTSCHRAARPKGFLAIAIVVAGGLGTCWVFRPRSDQAPVPPSRSTENGSAG